MAKATPINRRIAFQLNVAMVFEALILNRLLRLPKNRHEDWLRGLLVQGFLSECRARRELQPADQSASGVLQPSATHQEAVNRRSPESQQETDAPTNLVIVSEQPPGNPVSFAALRKVIG